MAGSRPEYIDTARALASPIYEDEPPAYPGRDTHSRSPLWSRRSLDSPITSGGRRPPARTHSSRAAHDDHRPLPRTRTARWMRQAESGWNAYMKFWYSFSPLQRAGITVLNVGILTLVILFVVYNEKIFGALVPAVKKWREMRGGWVIMWVLTVVVAFPPMVGYSTCITVAGMVWGMHAWWIVASASALGSGLSLIVSRTVLKNFVGRLTKDDKRFAALSLVLKHDGLKLLIMIRLCPLPYSLSNGAISTIPTVTWYNMIIATACASPKLLLGVFVGRQVGNLAENGAKMDFATRIASYIGIAIGVAAGIGTGYFIYVRTKARAAQLEAEEAEAAIRGPRTSDAANDYIDDPAEQTAVDILRQEDDISLHQTYDDLERQGYRDDFTDDEDAQERDVFADGDGDDEDDVNGLEAKNIGR